MKKPTAWPGKTRISPADASQLLDGLRDMDNILRICDFGKKKEYSGDVKHLLRQRNEARQNHNWKTADKIRQKLARLGVQVHDQKVGI